MTNKPSFVAFEKRILLRLKVNKCPRRIFRRRYRKWISGCFLLLTTAVAHCTKSGLIKHPPISEIIPIAEKMFLNDGQLGLGRVLADRDWRTQESVFLALLSGISGPQNAF